ncbi:MAG: alkaline phosphatase PhoX [Aquificaceae bacterium]
MSKLWLGLLSAVYLTFVSCGSSSGTTTREFQHIDFAELPYAPYDDPEVKTSPYVIITYSDGTQEKALLSYKVLFKTGDKDAYGNAAGQLLDKDGKPILFPDGSRLFSNQQDATAFFERSGKYYWMQHFESSPGAVYLVDLNVKSDGTLSPSRYRNIDFSSVGGTFINCSGQKSPWDTFLSAEEDYYLSAYHFDPASKDFIPMHINYCEKDSQGNLTGKYIPPNFAPTEDYGWWCAELVKPLITDYLKIRPEQFNPYYYGHIVEIGVDKNGNPNIVGGIKRFAMGKFTPEVAVVMPDRKTVYMLDDGAWTGMFMFVADKENDLSSGTLYMANVKQISSDDTDGGSFEINWVKLGHGSDKEINELVDRGITMSDIFDIADPNNCTAGYTKMYTYDSAGTMGGRAMCLRLRDGSNSSAISPKFKSTDEVRKAAAFLHPRQYGVLLGATSEFSKGEGVSYDWDKKVVYFVMSRVEKSMTKGKGTTDTQDDIRIKDNKCGAIYEGNFGKAKDNKDNPINSSYVVRKLEAILVGKPLKPGDPDSDKNACAIDSISNPDNILYIGKNILLIAEDSGFHYNNMLWAYNTKTKKLTRIGIVPPGAEVTGAAANISINGRKYIAFHAQHPYGESRYNAEGKKVFSGSSYQDTESLKEEKYKGITGYIFGLPDF